MRACTLGDGAWQSIGSNASGRVAGGSYRADVRGEASLTVLVPAAPSQWGCGWIGASPQGGLRYRISETASVCAEG